MDAACDGPVPPHAAMVKSATSADTIAALMIVVRRGMSGLVTPEGLRQGNNRCNPSRRNQSCAGASRRVVHRLSLGRRDETVEVALVHLMY